MHSKRLSIAGLHIAYTPASKCMSALLPRRMCMGAWAHGPPAAPTREGWAGREEQERSAYSFAGAATTGAVPEAPSSCEGGRTAVLGRFQGFIFYRTPALLPGCTTCPFAAQNVTQTV